MLSVLPSELNLGLITQVCQSFDVIGLLEGNISKADPVEGLLDTKSSLKCLVTINTVIDVCYNASRYAEKSL